MSFIAFDAAKRRTGYAYVGGRHTTHWWITGVIDVANTAELAKVIDRAKREGVTRAAIENCYHGRNVHTTKALQEAQTRIRVACEMAGLPVALIYASTWQAAYGITGPSADRKLGAKRIALMLGASDGLSQDEYDAVCLCDYATLNARELEVTG